MNTIEKALANLGQPKIPKNGDETYTPIEHSDNYKPADKHRLSENVSAPRQSSPDLDDPVIDIPFDALQAAGYLTPAIPRSITAEEFRTIKRPLLNNIRGRSGVRVNNANLIMVTSALEGDGKTYTSLNLAMSIAMEQNKTVLYIDADVRKATAGDFLGISSETPGLIDLLSDDAVEPQDVILRTNVDNLRILPAGAPSEHATELLAGEGMRQLMLELSERYSDRVIVFDSPPLLLTTESAVLTSFMGQIVFVVAANATPQHAVTQALEKISENKVVGMVLNKAPRRSFSLFGLNQGYGYGYGYAYGQRERENTTATEEAKR